MPTQPSSVVNHSLSSPEGKAYLVEILRPLKDLTGRPIIVVEPALTKLAMAYAQDFSIQVKGSWVSLKGPAGPVAMYCSDKPLRSTVQLDGMCLNAMMSRLQVLNAQAFLDRDSEPDDFDTLAILHEHLVRELTLSVSPCYIEECVSEQELYVVYQGRLLMIEAITLKGPNNAVSGPRVRWYEARLEGVEPLVDVTDLEMFVLRDRTNPETASVVAKVNDLLKREAAWQVDSITAITQTSGEPLLRLKLRQRYRGRIANEVLVAVVEGANEGTLDCLLSATSDAPVDGVFVDNVAFHETLGVIEISTIKE